MTCAANGWIWPPITACVPALDAPGAHGIAVGVWSSKAAQQSGERRMLPVQTNRIRRADSLGQIELAATGRDVRCYWVGILAVLASQGLVCLLPGSRQLGQPARPAPRYPLINSLSDSAVALFRPGRRLRLHPKMQGCR